MAIHSSQDSESLEITSSKINPWYLLAPRTWTVRKELKSLAITCKWTNPRSSPITQDCLSPRNYTGQSFDELCWNEALVRRPFLKFCNENADKNENKLYMEKLKTSCLCHKIICRPSQSCEIIPLTSNRKMAPTSDDQLLSWLYSKQLILLQ